MDEIKKGNNIIDKLTNEINNKKSKLKSVKQTVEAQDKLIFQKQNIILTQSKNLDDMKKEKEMKELQIIALKNKIDNYIMKLNENEKLLEEDKQMILYLNKNINDITNAPFKSRFQQSLINDKFMSSNFFNSNDFNEKNNYLEEEKKLNLKDNDLNYVLSDNNNSFENKDSKNLFHNNYYYHDLNLLNNNDSEEDMIILPETNLCNYHVSGKLGGMMDKYMNKEGLINYDFNNNKDLLLEHKYGGNSLNNEDEKNDYNKRSTYNIEEEFPNKLKNNHN